MSKKALSFRKHLQIHAGHGGRSHGQLQGVPIYQTTSYVFNSAEHGANSLCLKMSLVNIYPGLMNIIPQMFF